MEESAKRKRSIDCDSIKRIKIDTDNPSNTDHTQQNRVNESLVTGFNEDNYRNDIIQLTSSTEVVASPANQSPHQSCDIPSRNEVDLMASNEKKISNKVILSTSTNETVTSEIDLTLVNEDPCQDKIDLTTEGEAPNPNQIDLTTSSNEEQSPNDVDLTSSGEIFTSSKVVINSNKMTNQNVVEKTLLTNLNEKHFEEINKSTESFQKENNTTKESFCDDEFIYYNTKRPWDLYPLIKPYKVAEYQALDIYNNDGTYYKGCKWSPDGSYLLTSSNDSKLRLFPVPDQLYEANINLKDFEWLPKVEANLYKNTIIYDFEWFPLMDSKHPETCRFACTSRNNAVDLFDCFTGKCISTYIAKNHLDEMVSAYSITFSPDGRQLYTGFKKMIRLFDVERKTYFERPTYVKDGQNGIISVIAVNPDKPYMYAAGSYNKTVGIYCEPTGAMEYLFTGHKNGVTHISFSNDGNRLYSGTRNGDEIVCWDIRVPGNVLYSVTRDVQTNQRIYFDIDKSDNFLMSGSHSGEVIIWNTKGKVQQDPGLEPTLSNMTSFHAHNDVVNGISSHPHMPVIATTSGRRKFTTSTLDVFSSSESEEDSTTIMNSRREASVKLWWLQEKDDPG